MLTKILLGFTIVCNFATLLGLWITYQTAPASIQNRLGHEFLLWGAIASILLYVAFAIFVMRPKMHEGKTATENPGNTDWHKLFAEEKKARDDYQEKYAECSNELATLKKAQKPIPAHPIPDLALKILEKCQDLKAFMGTYGDGVRTNRHDNESVEQHMERLSAPALKQLRIRFVGEYHLHHQESVIQLRDELRARCSINDEALDHAINFARSGNAGTADCVDTIIVKFWEIARNVTV